MTPEQKLAALQQLKELKAMRSQLVREDLKRTNPGEYDPESAEFKAKYGATSGMSGLDKFRAGVGSGLQDIRHGALNLFGITSDDKLREKKELDRELLDTGAGAVGNFVGQVAATLPVGGAVGQGARLLSSTSTPLAAAGRALVTPAARNAVEGAVGAALSAGPDEQDSAALQGAAAGAGFSVLGRTLGRLNRGLIEKSDPAATLQSQASQHGEDLFIPASQAAKPDGDLTTRAFAGAYRGALPFIPGVGAKIEGQADDARQIVRRMAAKEADPSDVFATQGIPDEGLQARKILRDTYEQEYQNTVKSYAFNVPADFRKEVVDRIRKEIPNIDDVSLNRAVNVIDEQMARFSNGQNVIDGDNLLQAKNAASRAIKGLQGREKDAAVKAHGIFDDLVRNELKAGNSKQNLADLDRWERLNDTWRTFRGYGKAVEGAKANRGNFTMNQLARAAPEGTPLHVIAQDANEVLGRRATGGDPQGRFLTGAALGGYALFDPANIARAAAGMTGAQLLATRKAQEFMLGDTATQRAVAAFLRKNAKNLERAGLAGRMAVATEIGDANE